MNRRCRIGALLSAMLSLAACSDGSSDETSPGGGGGIAGHGGAAGGAGGSGGVALTEHTLQYDDGGCQITNAPSGDTQPGGMTAVCFSPPAHPAQLVSASFHVADRGVATTTFGVAVFLADGPVLSPGTRIDNSSLEAAAAAGDAWVDVDLTPAELSITSGDFCVAMEWLTPAGNNLASPDAQTICGDNANPDGRSWIDWSGDVSGWARFQDIGVMEPLDLGIRVTVAAP